MTHRRCQTRQQQRRKEAFLKKYSMVEQSPGSNANFKQLMAQVKTILTKNEGQIKSDATSTTNSMKGSAIKERPPHRKQATQEHISTFDPSRYPSFMKDVDYDNQLNSMMSTNRSHFSPLPVVTPSSLNPDYHHPIPIRMQSNPRTWNPKRNLLTGFDPGNSKQLKIFKLNRFNTKKSSA